MLHYFQKPPLKVYVAVSGGVDSMTILHHLKNGGRDVTALIFNHGLEFENSMINMVKEFCKKQDIPTKIGKISDSEGKGSEKFWREQRYKFLDQFTDAPVITCHHLNDAIEWWVLSSLRGEGKLIPYQRGNYIRPFIITTRKELMEMAIRQHTPWIDDPTNFDPRYCQRNYIRHTLLPHVLAINPGMESTIRKKYLKLREADRKVS